MVFDFFWHFFGNVAVWIEKMGKVSDQHFAWVVWGSNSKLSRIYSTDYLNHRKNIENNWLLMYNLLGLKRINGVPKH